MGNLTDNLTEKIKNGISAGTNKVSLQAFSEHITVDETWIDSVESLLFSVEKIVRRPRTFIAENKIVVPVEKSKRVTSETIRHLSSHTSNIRGIADDGSVQPSKLLSTLYSDEYTIYENRFIGMLITQLFIFVDKQFKAIGTAVPTEKTKSHHICNFDINDAKVEYEMSISFTMPEPEGNEIRKKFNKRLEDLHKRITILRNTEFYRTIKKMKQVQPPIMKTNIIKSDVDYNNAYRLWLFIGSNDFCGYTLDVAEKVLQIKSGYEEGLKKVCATGVQTFMKSMQKQMQHVASLPYKPKKAKSFKVWKNYTYVPQLDAKPDASKNVDALDFYDSRIRTMFSDILFPYGKAVTEEGEKDIAFNSLFKDVTDINDSIYYDLLGVDNAKFEPLPDESAAEKKERERKIALTNYSMLKLLAQHKERDAKATLKLAAKNKSRADKLQRELERLELEKAKRELAQRQKEERERAKLALAEQKAEKERLRKEKIAKQKEEAQKRSEELAQRKEQEKLLALQQTKKDAGSKYVAAPGVKKLHVINHTDEAVATFVETGNVIIHADPQKANEAEISEKAVETVAVKEPEQVIAPQVVQQAETAEVDVAPKLQTYEEASWKTAVAVNAPEAMLAEALTAAEETLAADTQEKVQEEAKEEKKKAIEIFTLAREAEYKIIEEPKAKKAEEWQDKQFAAENESKVLTDEVMEEIIRVAEEKAEKLLQARIAAEQRNSAARLEARKAQARARVDKKR